MRRPLILILLLFDLICFGQTSNPEFKLSLDFYPSFMGPGNVTISSKQDTNSIVLIVYKNKDKCTWYQNKQTKIRKGEMDTIADFFKTYNFRIKGSVDTIGVHKEIINGKSLTMYDMDIGVDGITVDGTYTQGNIMKKFAFWSPRKETENHRLMVLVFSMLYQSFSDDIIVNYIEKLEDYFSGMPQGNRNRRIIENRFKD
jgi:hypothetical protein